ncbi:glycosyltransferase family 87 protein [Mongoliimonas terrestris]|uniref:glycosyltransferase family 87 protein n=1 Tax=Mongoliimonas terrestris TaxID=1709001 RepID=UPI000B12034F|nr:glycosyltransferase family 87 protein [Mongoliimonas terrestris]
MSATNTPMTPAAPATPRFGSVLKRHVALLVVVLALSIVMRMLTLSGLVETDGSKELVDYEVFHVAGQMVWRGEIVDAYAFLKMAEAEAAYAGWDTPETIMPWNYPPPFNLVVAALALLPVWLGYGVFIGATMAAYLIVLRRIAGDAFALVLVAFFPAMTVTVSCGQNGFLTGTLIGLAGLALADGRRRAGLPLGLMVIKPHIAVTFALFTVLTRRWAVVAIAAVTVALTSLLATALLGPAVWGAFVAGAGEAKFLMAEGLFPLFRMVSPYSTVRTLVPSPEIAILVHGIVAAVALGLAALAVRRFETRQAIGMMAVLALSISPYAYDYDLPVIAVGAAFLAPTLRDHARRGELIALMALAFLASGFGLAQTRNLEAMAIPPVPGQDPLTLSISGLLIVVGVVFVWRVLERARAAATPAAV